MALWPFGSKEKAVLTPEQRTALTSIVKKSKFEIIPLKGSRKNRMRCRPVQRSPAAIAGERHRGHRRTRRVADANRQGCDVIPHLSSKLVRDRSHLGELLTRIRAAGMKKVFVVGGDGDAIGSFTDGVDLVRAVAESGQPLDEIGVPRSGRALRYPERQADAGAEG